MSKEIEEIIKKAFAEDFNNLGDITTLALFDNDEVSQGNFICEKNGVLSGLKVAKECFSLYDKSIVFKSSKSDADFVKEKEVIATVKGNIRSILAVERTALNFLSHLSGIATLTSTFVHEIKGTGCILKDTRKTLPGLRILEKAAVRDGGGQNHRNGLYDAILIKDNHLSTRSIKEAVYLARSKYPNHKIEVEIDTLEQAKEAIFAQADILLLDNMDVGVLQKAVKLINGRAQTEASGGITLKNVKKVAQTGVDFISTSTITMAASPLSISLELVIGK